MKNYNKLILTRVDKSFNIILIMTSTIGFIASIFLYIADLPIIYSLLNFSTGVIMLVFFVMANRIKTSNKIIATIMVTEMIAVASFIGGGFSSAFLTLLLLGNIIAVLFLEFKTSVIISFLSVILMFGLGYYSIVFAEFSAIIEPIITWGLQIVAYVLFIVVLHISSYSMKIYLFENIEGLESAIRKTNQLAYYDQLTKLPNVYKFKQEVEEIIKNHKNDGFILIFSLKSLSLINSTLGYEIGNQSLIETTELLKRIIGNQGVIAKTGGNEFVIWIDQISEEDFFIKYSKVISDLKDQSLVIKKKLEFHTVFVSFTYGKETLDECYQKGILTLTYAKNNNFNGLLSYNDELEAGFRRTERIKDLLEHALDQHEISLHYQGKYDVRYNRIIGLEALARWNSPDVGYISPSEFIPIIESMNLSATFGIFVINQVCKDFRRLQENYNDDICVSINISPSHIRDPNIIMTIREALNKYSIPSGRITLEITEDIIIKGIDEVKPILKELREMNLKISLDDFGTGYSSLNYLTQLELDELKIDKSFVDQIGKSEYIHILIENIINLSKQLKLAVVAEGVETKEQNDVLNELGCYVIQGYYYSKPKKL